MGNSDRKTAAIRKLIDEADCPSAPCSRSYYTFRNADGQSIQLRGDLTMEDLIRMGWTDFRLTRTEDTLPPHVWRCESTPENA